VTLKTYPGAYHEFDAPNVPIRVRADVPSANGGRGVHVGTDPAARADALEQAPTFLARYLKPDA
jgi:dienelactone hydrolase